VKFAYRPSIRDVKSAGDMKFAIAQNLLAATISEKINQSGTQGSE